MVNNQSSKHPSNDYSHGHKNTKETQFTSAIKPENTIQISDSIEPKGNEIKPVNFTAKSRINSETEVLLNQNNHYLSQPKFLGQKNEIKFKQSNDSTFLEAVGNFFTRLGLSLISVLIFIFIVALIFVDAADAIAVVIIFSIPVFLLTFIILTIAGIPGKKQLMIFGPRRIGTLLKKNLYKLFTSNP